MEKQFEEYSYIKENYKYLLEKIYNAASLAGKNGDNITLIAVSKTVEIEKINYALSLGLNNIGENKVQEYLEKYDYLSDCNRHLIGHLQSNKVKKIVGKVDMIQSVDSVSIANEIGKRSCDNKIITDILLQINAGNEESKFGFSVEEIEERLFEISQIKGIKIRGLMAVAPICESESEIRKIFSVINNKFIDIDSKNIDNVSMDFLSMGMSGDFEAAIAEGSNMVRVGTSLFGKRIYY